jgi:hypothetical protein
MNTKTKKATFNLHTDVIAALDEAMSQGMASSKNALVEQALVKELRELKKQSRKAQYQAAAQDPLFVRDISRIEADFKYADSETAGSIDL